MNGAPAWPWLVLVVGATLTWLLWPARKAYEIYFVRDRSEYGPSGNRVGTVSEITKQTGARDMEVALRIGTRWLEQFEPTPAFPMATVLVRGNEGLVAAWARTRSDTFTLPYDERLDRHLDRMLAHGPQFSPAVA